MLHNGYYQKLRAIQSDEAVAAMTAANEPPRTSPSAFSNDVTAVPLPETVESDLYIPGYLSGQIGRYMRVEFLIGNTLTDRNGRLTKVGASYITLESQNGDLVVCDLFSIKFITVVHSPQMII